MVAPVEALAAVPEGLTDAEAAPLLCAGITTYNALRHSGAMPGDLVAVLGVGGLGHLGIQFANKFGYKVVAIGRGSESAALAKKLGASVYVDNRVTNPVEAAKAGRRAGNLSDSSELKSDVRAVRWSRAERQTHGDRCDVRSP
jgi:D-arabinose 1-dehydrogenase-like Zn-dependent alcohol dehydrogenase